MHHHGHVHPGGERLADRSRRPLAVVLGLTLAFAGVEAAGGVLTGSLALLADAGHMLADASFLGLALFAAWLGGRPSTPRRSFGFARAEILAALANGLALVAVALLLLFEGARRLGERGDVLGGWMLGIALGGLAVNVAGASILARAGRESLNVRAAFRHVVADLLGSLGVIAAALTILLTGWTLADPLVSILIALLVLASSWDVLRDSLSILLEATPRGIDAEQVGNSMAAVEGVFEVHDLHVWTITSGFPALSAHVLVGRRQDCHAVRRELESVLRERFGIRHSTLQVEHVPASVAPIELGREIRRRAPLDRG
ncbi:MAG: cation transporter [Actinobacteria bacterium]|nr:cation transporter [Actinomycetota bacterium]